MRNSHNSLRIILDNQNIFPIDKGDMVSSLKSAVCTLIIEEKVMRDALSDVLKEHDFLKRKSKSLSTLINTIHNAASSDVVGVDGCPIKARYDEIISRSRDVEDIIREEEKKIGVVESERGILQKMLERLGHN
jgi:hypothetical protein